MASTEKQNESISFVRSQVKEWQGLVGDFPHCRQINELQASNLQKHLHKLFVDVSI